MSTPLIMLAASEANHTTVSETSRGTAKRPSGIRASIGRAFSSSPQHVVTERQQFLDGLSELIAKNLETGDIAYEGIPGQTQP